MSELSSQLLVAMPQLDDPNFKRSVVLLVHHGEGGSFGIVLNRSLDLTMSELMQNSGIQWPAGVGSVGWGGPVQPERGWVVFCDDAPPAAAPDGGGEDDDVATLGHGVRVTGSLDKLRSVASHPPSAVRLFLGYAGWGAEQLESELAEGAWLLAPLRREVVFDTAEDHMWEAVVRGLGIDPTALVPARGIH
ncbi:MAG: YqgE/AlgH family protein [Deltaproteobacteria bacterium]|nr:YqgE/AlgH family protein [Deltaproteobacteria bacterium]